MNALKFKAGIELRYGHDNTTEAPQPSTPRPPLLKRIEKRIDRSKRVKHGNTRGRYLTNEKPGACVHNS